MKLAAMPSGLGGEEQGRNFGNKTNPLVKVRILPLQQKKLLAAGVFCFYRHRKSSGGGKRLLLGLKDFYRTFEAFFQ